MTDRRSEDQEHTLSQEDLIRENTDTPVAHRVYDTVAGIQSPAPLPDIADLALCTEAEAKPILTLLADIGAINVEQTDDEPRQYWRNESFFRCQRAMELANEFETTEGLTDLEHELEQTRATIQDIYEVESIEDLPLDTENSALREHVREDADQWALIDQTLTDLRLAKVIHDIDTGESDDTVSE